MNKDYERGYKDGLKERYRGGEDKKERIMSVTNEGGITKEELWRHCAPYMNSREFMNAIDQLINEYKIAVKSVDGCFRISKIKGGN